MTALWAFLTILFYSNKTWPLSTPNRFDDSQSDQFETPKNVKFPHLGAWVNGSSDNRWLNKLRVLNNT